MRQASIKKPKDLYKILGGLFLLTTLSIIFLTVILYSGNEKLDIQRCLDTQGEQERIDCYRALVSEALRKNGMQRAFAIVKDVYEKDPSFATNCHEFSHLIGEEAYVQFKQGSKFEVAPETYYCGYGFYHGFIIKLMSSGDDLSLAHQFCVYTDEAIRENSQVANLDCYHGIGHGVTDYNATDLLTSGKEQVLIDNSIALCEEVSSNEGQLLRCVDGIFHSIGDIYLGDPDYASSKRARDPVALCRRQGLEYRKVCYGSMGYLVMQNFNDDFDNALAYASQIQEPEYQEAIIRPMAGYRSYSTLNMNKDRENIISCVFLRESLAKECLSGLIEGLSDFGTPGREHEEVARFCQIEDLPVWVKDFCLDHAVEYFNSYFGQEKKSLLCSLIEPRAQCED